MGVNYFFEAPRCSHCGRAAEVMHIGKSTIGWAFMLHVEPEDGLTNLDDWKKLFDDRPDWLIVDEFQVRYSAEEMIKMILTPPASRIVLRHSVAIVGDSCVGHEETYDMIRGVFN